jgi:phosphate-selective porin OprO/OprP
VVTAAVRAGAEDAPPPPQEYEIKAYAASVSWDEGVHYGVDVPAWQEIWDTGELRWRPLIRGDVGPRLSIDTAGLRRRGRFVDLDDDVGVRRAYFYLDGRFEDLWKPLTFKFEIGAVGDSFSLRNASLSLHELPYAGTLTLGTFDAPASLSYLTSSRATPLMETGLPVEALVPGTQSGVMLANWLSRYRISWASGLFSEGKDSDVGDSSNVPVRFVGRTTWLPYRITERHLLHLGLNASWAFSPSDDIQYRSRPESFLAPYVFDTGEIDGQQTLLLGPEVMWMRNRLSVQGEYLQSLVFRDATSNKRFGGLYVTTSYFLTRDARAYDERSASFTTLVPSRPLSWTARQLGAFEVAFRWSYLDLNTGQIRGGSGNELMSGLNWYWNRYVRVQFNVGWFHASDGPRPGSYVVLQSRIDLMI